MEAAAVELLLSSSSSSSSSCSSSSSSFLDSSSEDDIMMLDTLFKRQECHKPVNFAENVEKYTDNEFREQFRVSRSTATLLTQQFVNSGHYKQKLNCGGRKATSAENICLEFLWFAGDKRTYRDVSILFGISLSSAYRHQTDFMNFLCDVFTQHIRMPSTTAEKEEKSTQFSKIAGLDYVLGCIAGCNVQIRNTTKQPTWQDLISLRLQCICDADGRFLNVFVGPAGETNDARLFKMSDVSEGIATLCEGKYYLLGDAVYPLREYLLTPYADFGDLNSKQKKFNAKHCQTKTTIAHSLGLLKQRFGQLTRLDFGTASRAAKFVIGCCVLYNICIEEGDLWPLDVKKFNEVAAASYEAGQTTQSLGEEFNIPVTFSLQKGESKRIVITESL